MYGIDGYSHFSRFYLILYQFQTPLHLATITKHAGIVKLLLEAGASPNTPDRKGNTCCHLAVKKNCIECLQVLIESSIEKADIDAKNFEGRQWLMYFIFSEFNC